MLQGWVVVLIALIYLGLLFAVASIGDRRSVGLAAGRGRPAIYALSLAVYCTSWTFFGSVGLAAATGLEFLTIYLGPILMFSLGFPILRRVAKLAKAERITSIADFIAARYGKSQGVAAVVTLIAVTGTVPYIALQLKAVSTSVEIMVTHISDGSTAQLGSYFFSDVSLLVAIALAAFAILFGTRHIDATEHQDGLMLAIATESVVKLLAFVCVGVFATFVLFDGPFDMVEKASQQTAITEVFGNALNGGKWIVMTFLSFCAILLLPRQFHVTITENHNEAELKRAAWLFPVYLVLINLFVIPIAVAGMIRFGNTIDADTFVLALPMTADAELVTIIAFLGGLSAATAMVIVASIALAIMISNDLVIPLLLRRRSIDPVDPEGMGSRVLNIRRSAIFVVLLLAFAYYRAAGDTAALASIGLMSFAAIAQLAPAFFGGLIWRRATAKGAVAGMCVGFAVWAYTLLLPTFVSAGIVPEQILTAGPFGIWLLKPQALFSFSFDPLVHGVFWSISANIAAYAFVSVTFAPEPIERLQASIFVPTDLTPAPPFRRWRTSVTVGDLQSTIARYLGQERTKRAFERYSRERNTMLDENAEADFNLIRFSEQMLASAIGAASSRLVMSLLVKRRDTTQKVAMKLLDDASAAIQYNRDLLQTALDQVGQGISVFDKDMRLICWNRQYRELLGLPADFGQVGTPLHTIIRYCAEGGEFGTGDIDQIVAKRIDMLVVTMEPFVERLASSGAVLEVRTQPMPDGGIVTTYADITETVSAQDALATANENLEKRVRERTEELTRLNAALGQATAEAEEANIGKTRFLAAAGHDILQPLNAARLYVSSMVERYDGTDDSALVGNVEASIESVEEIIGALLDISRLDTGALKSDITTFAIADVFQQLEFDFGPMARDKGLDLRIVPTSLWVRSDRRLLRRLLQNLVSNAIKYTSDGKIILGCRQRDDKVLVEVLDTGMGIPQSQQKSIFDEFQRLERGARAARGLGLGLSIVDRISRFLDHPVNLRSKLGHGSRFSVEIPKESPIAVRPRAPRAKGVLDAPLEGLVVLCIDNEPKILDGMKTLLTGWKCQVLVARDLEDAEREIDTASVMPDAIVADYHLDIGNGIDTIIALRERFGTDISAVLVTADRSPAVKEEAREKGFSTLNKPLKPAVLRALLSQWRVQMQAAE